MRHLATIVVTWQTDVLTDRQTGVLSELPRRQLLSTPIMVSSADQRLVGTEAGGGATIASPSLLPRAKEGATVAAAHARSCRVRRRRQPQHGGATESTSSRRHAMLPYETRPHSPVRAAARANYARRRFARICHVRNARQSRLPTTENDAERKGALVEVHRPFFLLEYSTSPHKRIRLVYCEVKFSPCLRVMFTCCERQCAK